jgi:hypothetical protein
MIVNEVKMLKRPTYRQHTVKYTSKNFMHNIFCFLFKNELFRYIYIKDKVNIIFRSLQQPSEHDRSSQWENFDPKSN